ncbi:hypothetical protein [Nonomuraea sp. NPDC049695]|uniref:hypothetical protein n=1 Tax=Nonomuraea sp. NPDC049695 TaxID=3154734 RepID=UPI00341E8822
MRWGSGAAQMLDGQDWPADTIAILVGGSYTQVRAIRREVEAAETVSEASWVSRSALRRRGER